MTGNFLVEADKKITPIQRKKKRYQAGEMVKFNSTGRVAGPWVFARIVNGVWCTICKRWEYDVRPITPRKLSENVRSGIAPSRLKPVK